MRLGRGARLLLAGRQPVYTNHVIHQASNDLRQDALMRTIFDPVLKGQARRGGKTGQRQRGAAG
jgi:hypothetical protein